jgi:hypothetical protein
MGQKCAMRCEARSGSTVRTSRGSERQNGGASPWQVELAAAVIAAAVTPARSFAVALPQRLDRFALRVLLCRRSVTLALEQYIPIIEMQDLYLEEVLDADTGAGHLEEAAADVGDSEVFLIAGVVDGVGAGITL